MNTIVGYKCFGCRRIWSALHQTRCPDLKCGAPCEIVNISTHQSVQHHDSGYPSSIELATDEQNAHNQAIIRENGQQRLLFEGESDGAYMDNNKSKTEDTTSGTIDDSMCEFLTKARNLRLDGRGQSQGSESRPYTMRGNNKKYLTPKESVCDEIEQPMRAQQIDDHLQPRHVHSFFESNSREALDNLKAGKALISASDTIVATETQEEQLFAESASSTGVKVETKIACKEDSDVLEASSGKAKRKRRPRKKNRQSSSAVSGADKTASKYNVELPLPDFMLSGNQTRPKNSGTQPSTSKRNSYATVAKSGDSSGASADGWTEVKSKSTGSSALKTQTGIPRVPNASSYLVHKKGGAFGHGPDDERQDEDFDVAYGIRGAKHAVKTNVPRL